MASRLRQKRGASAIASRTKFSKELNCNANLQLNSVGNKSKKKQGVHEKTKKSISGLSYCMLCRYGYSPAITVVRGKVIIPYSVNDSICFIVGPLQ